MRCLLLATVLGTLTNGINTKSVIQQDTGKYLDPGDAVALLQRTALFRYRHQEAASPEQNLSKFETSATLEALQTQWTCISKVDPTKGMPLYAAILKEMNAVEDVVPLTKHKPCLFQLQRHHLRERAEEGEWQPQESGSHLAAAAAAAAAEAHVKSRNRTSVVIAVVWVLLAVAMLTWSVVAAIHAPRKHLKEGGAPGCVADEERAWKRSWITWTNLGWVDTLMGRYGKCQNTPVDLKEVVLGARRSHLEPQVLFHTAWDKEVAKRGGIESASMAWAMLDIIGNKTCLLLFCSAFMDCVLSNVGGVIALDILLRRLQTMQSAYVLNPDKPVDHLPATLITLFLLFFLPLIARGASVAVCLIDGYYSSICSAGLNAAIYDKALNLPVGHEGLAFKRPGEENEVGVPLNAVQQLNADLAFVWNGLLKTLAYAAVAPFAILALFVIILVRCRLAGLIGLTYFVLGAGFTNILQRRVAVACQKFQLHRESRLHRFAEALLHIRVIKTLTLEQLFFQRSVSAYDKELGARYDVEIGGSYMGANLHTLPHFVMLIVCLLFTAFKDDLKAANIFVMARLIFALHGQLQAISDGFTKLAVAPSTFTRAKNFLKQSARPVTLVRIPPLDEGGDVCARLRGSFTYLAELPPTLLGLDLELRRGELIAVVGASGSGKSALLQALVGDLYLCAGGASVEAPQELAYCAQVPWIFEGSLQENVLLMEDMDHERYHQVIQCAALEQDLRIMPGGDQVCIGASGIRLSEDQRSRVALARAAYSRCDLVLLDEPLALLDAHTSEHIFEEMLLGPIMRGRTRVVTMRPTAARMAKCDRVIVLEEGSIAVMGSPEEVVATDAFKRTQCSGNQIGLGNVVQPCHVGEDVELPKCPEATDPACDTFINGTTPRQKRKLIQVGTVPHRETQQDCSLWCSLLCWVEACGRLRLVFLATLIVASRLAILAASIVLARWVNRKAVASVNDHVYELALLIAVLAACCILLLEARVSALMQYRFAQYLHAELLQKLVRAPIDEFFDKQPIGRLFRQLSRHLQDTSQCSQPVIRLAVIFCTFITTQLYILAQLPVWFLAAAMPTYWAVCMFLYLYRGVMIPLTAAWKLASSRGFDAQEVVMASRASIRANGMMVHHLARYHKICVAAAHTEYLTYHVTKAWLQSRVTMGIVTLTVCCVLVGIQFQMSMGTLAAVICLSFAFLSDFDGAGLSVIRFVDLFNTLQRVAKFLEIPQEPGAKLPMDPKVGMSVVLQGRNLVQMRSSKPASDNGLTTRLTILNSESQAPLLEATDCGLALRVADGCDLGDVSPTCSALQGTKGLYCIVAVNGAWRSADDMAAELCDPGETVQLNLLPVERNGGVRLTLEDLNAGYGMNPSVLDSVSLDVPPRSKVGIVGLPGCGKSTILRCMLRLVACRSGKVLLDGLDTCSLGLDTLRSLIALVPEEPVIFEGSWRFNLDPFGDVPDARIWDVLQRFQLLPVVRALPSGLNSPLTCDGAGLNLAQQQLLSLARAALRQPAVLLLDECTSALDDRTQEIIWNLLSTDFPRSTIVAVESAVENLRECEHVYRLEEGKLLAQNDGSSP